MGGFAWISLSILFLPKSILHFMAYDDIEISFKVKQETVAKQNLREELLCEKNVGIFLDLPFLCTAFSMSQDCG